MTNVQPRPNSAPNPSHPADAALERELAQVFVEALNLEQSPEEIDPAAPLYDDGLGLDSIDILEIALVVSKRYGIELRADDENNKQIFSSLRGLAAYIQARRTR